MVKDFIGEKWETVKFDFEYANDYTLEVSNFGRLKTYNKISKGTLLNGSMIKGYRIVRLTFFSARDPQVEAKFRLLQKQILDYARNLRALKKNLADTDSSSVEYNQLKEKIGRSDDLLASLKKTISKQFQEDLKSRTIRYHCLIHRLVAEYFCHKPSEEYVFVGHIDFDKLNNHYSNLVWMTKEESNRHRVGHQTLPAEVIEQKRLAIRNSKVTKLTVTKVMLLKKLLNQGKPMRTLVKQFKVTETQIRRIQKGENWADVSASS